MAHRKTICPNHGVIESIEMDCMWLAPPPDAPNFCPVCGERTVVELPERVSSMTMWAHPTDEESLRNKQAEIERYRQKYWPGMTFHREVS